MNNTIMPVTAQGEPIPLIKLGQGRGDEHESGPLETPQTFAAKLRAADYQEPVLPAKPDGALPQSGVPEWAKNDGRKGADSPPPVVSREGFRAGVLSAIAGGVIIACFYLAWGLVAACLFTAVCIGFVAGMVMTEEWK